MQSPVSPRSETTMSQEIERRFESQALLVRAADLEIKRQSARRRGDLDLEQHFHDELARVWERVCELEGVAA
jgi:hypothetical protein